MSHHRSLQGRVALVTGVSRRIGIGAAITQRLLSEGASVLVSGFEPHDEEMPWSTDRGGAREELAQHEAAAGRLCHHDDADFEDPETADRLVAATVERFGAIDIVVANHARSSCQPFETVTADELDRCWAINARGSLLLARSLYDRRRRGPGGRLILFTSGQHAAPMPGEIAYAVSKGAIHQMTATLADAMIDRGITVNCIDPGPTDTGYARGQDRAIIEQMFPAKRWGSTEDVANLVAWLVSDQAAWITGQVHVSEGGFRRWARIELDDPSDRAPRLMTGEHALEILAALEACGVAASVDGGWGVDALIGHQTRPHEDLDLVVALQDVDAIQPALGAFGYTVAEDHLPVRLVMRDQSGSQLDFHTVTFDEQGGGIQRLPGGDSFRYPPEGFIRGQIAGQPIPCISAEVQVLCHLGYEPTSKDANDVLLLCRHFNLAVPSVYRDLTN